LKNNPKISIVVAVTKKDAAIGNGGELLHHISDDLKRFKNLTMGHPLIFGRKTFESIGRPLPGRTNIIITRNPDFEAPGCIVVPSLEKAIEEAGKIDNEIFIGGGGEIYKQALPITDKLYLTIVESDAEGNIFFPDWRKDFAKENFREERVDEKTGLKYTWVDLERNVL
jgi:dihydrofolate reductase